MTKKQYELLLFEFFLERNIVTEYTYALNDKKINILSYLPHKWIILISDIIKSYGWATLSKQILKTNSSWIALISSHGYNTNDLEYIEDSMQAIDILLKRM